MTAAPPYIYNVEFSVDKIDVFAIPDMDTTEELDTLIQFEMRPNVLLQITEDELIDAINCGEKRIKHTMFSLTEHQLSEDLEGRIVAKKVKCADNHVTVGSHKISQLNESFAKLKTRFDKQQMKNQQQAVRIATPITSTMQELAPLRDSVNKQCGILLYTLKLTCFGPHVTRELSFSNDFDGFLTDCSASVRSKATVKEHKCLSKCEPKAEYDEYAAELNGNSLIVRLSKDSPYIVSRDSEEANSNDKLTIRGCGQQIDFDFPNNFLCCHCKKTFTSCKCNGDSHLTEFQRRTSCAGSTYKNAFTLPVIRGNLKYPGRFDDQSIGFNVRSDCRSSESTKTHCVQADTTRNACLQVDGENLARELAGECKMSKGIKMCKLSCDKDSDVFVLKLGRKGKSRGGKNHEIELEMRTPRGPNVGPKRMETREIQVIEDEFEDVIARRQREQQERQEAEEREKELASKAQINGNGNGKAPVKKGGALKKAVPVKRK